MRNINYLCVFLFLFTSFAIAAPSDNVNLDFQRLRLADALHVYADFSGVNIIVDSRLDDMVDIDLRNVRVATFLDVLVDLYDLHVTTKENVLLVMRRSDFETRHSSRQTSVIPIHFSSAELLAESLNKQSQQQSSSSNGLSQTPAQKNFITFDARSNSVVLEGTADFVERTTGIIKSLDKKAKQLLISAKLVSMSSDDAKNLGAKLSASSQASVEKNVLSASAFSNLALATATGGYSFMLGKVGSYLLDMEVQALQQKGKVDILSRPSVLTLNNEKAKISQGLQIPFQVRDNQGSFHTEFQDAALSLEVLPRFSEDNIILEILVTKDNAGSTVAAGTTIEKRQISTVVQVKPGETVILGGIREQVTSKTTQESPLFKGIPILSWLFTSDQSSDSSKELLVFISPTLVDS